MATADAMAVPPGFATRFKRFFGSKEFQKAVTVIFFLAPALLVFVIFVVYPIVQSGYYSFFNWKGFGAKTFVGLGNFAQILKDTIFQTSVLHNVIIMALSLTIQLPLSLLLAIMVGRELPGRAFFRTIFFMPYVISEVVVGIMWLGLYNPDPERGLFNGILTLIPGMKAFPWLGNTESVLACVFVILTWKYFGLHMLLYMAGLQNIPKELEEAARIDGANSFQLLRFITIPLLLGTIRTSVYLSALGSLQQFIIIWIMTKGGPVNASDVMATYMYRFSFVRFWYGYGSAVALVMLLISLTVSISYQRIFRVQEYLGM
jgi:raffinose/stachyose/melibiose transport system permease protein